MRPIILFLATILAFAAPVLAGAAPAMDTISYRGFTINISAIGNTPDSAPVVSSVKHQLDIVADCGATSEIMAFFRAQPITVAPNALDTGGLYDRAHGIRIDAVAQPAGEPIILHEMLHAFHALVLPQGFQNPGVLNYYLHAKDASLYPADAFLLKNQAEYFAVTASLYLYGHVDRPPFTRENLRAKQPYYYIWLGKLFGVQK